MLFKCIQNAPTGSVESPFGLSNGNIKKPRLFLSTLNQSTELIHEFHLPSAPFICQILCSLPWCLAVYLSVCLSQGCREVSLNLYCIIIDIHCRWYQHTWHQKSFLILGTILFNIVSLYCIHVNLHLINAGDCHWFQYNKVVVQSIISLTRLYCI